MNPGERLEFTNGVDITGKSISFTVNDGRFALVRNGIDASGQPRTSAPSPVPASKDLTDLKGLLVVPAAIDMHVHSRDPGFPEKETWQTLAAGAYKGGVTYVCDMPNTNPPVMGAAEIREKALRARESSLNFSLYLGASQSNMANLKALLTDSALPICGLKVYYGQSTGNLMFDDLESLAKLFPRESGKVLAFHSEDQCGIDRQMEEFLPLMKESGYRDYSFHSKVRSSDDDSRLGFKTSIGNPHRPCQYANRSPAHRLLPKKGPKSHHRSGSSSPVIQH
jgi:dihydroorotase-like cyclic amidohydrolase